MGPVFGSIKPTPPSSTSISSSLLLLLLLGGVGVAAVLKGKSASSKNEVASKNEAREEKRRARAEEQVDLPSTERLQYKPCEESPTLSSTCPIHSSCIKEEHKTQEMPTKSTTTLKELITSPTATAEVKCKEKTKVTNESETRIEEKTRKEKAKEEESMPVLEGAAKLKEETRIVPKIIVSPEVVKQVVPVPLKAESVKETILTEQCRTPSAKTNRVEDLSINLTTVDELEEVDYITKIKTFKITRWPKTHTADLVQHGPESLLSVLLPMQLQKCDEWKDDVKSFSADLSIEGANISRLLITVVTEKGEEESVAKTMTIKEYMVTISNKIIEDAVKVP